MLIWPLHFVFLYRVQHGHVFLNGSQPNRNSILQRVPILSQHVSAATKLNSSLEDENDKALNRPIAVTIDTVLSEDKVKALFAWIKCAFSDTNVNNDLYGFEYYYSNIELAIAAAFGNNLPKDSLPAKLMEMALKNQGELSQKWEEDLIGEAIGKRQRESASLGAMGAAQWSGRWMTRPHSLLDVRSFTSVDDWIKTLKRGCRRTLIKATPELQNFYVLHKPIRGNRPAPHSSYAHFQCVVEHEVRLLKKMYGPSTGAFVNALAEAISRFMGTTQMTGSIKEYRDIHSRKIIGFAHEVSKGRTIRGQWFYCNDDAATRYVWFHSVCDLVQRAIDDERIDVVDLGPSGSDTFTELKSKYGFESIVDWPSVADYDGEFLYEQNQND